MNHDDHTTDVDPHGGPRPEPRWTRESWIDTPLGGLVATLASCGLIFLLGIIIGAALSR